MFGREIKEGMGNITRSFWMILRAWMYEFCKQQKKQIFSPITKVKYGNMKKLTTELEWFVVIFDAVVCAVWRASTNFQFFIRKSCFNATNQIIIFFLKFLCIFCCRRERKIFKELILVKNKGGAGRRQGN